MKKTILLFGVFLASYTFAQVSISPVSTDTPQATLDVKAMTTTGNAVEGILIPRVDRAKAGLMTAANIQTSTMIYVNSIANGSTSGITADVDAVGFYYYNGTKWVKVGAEPAKTVRTVAHITTAEWANNQYALVQTGNNGIQLPPASSNKDRIISVNNQYGSAVQYASPSPKNNSSIFPGHGHLLISDGTSWYVISGGY